MIKVAFVRGSFLNNFESQNYNFNDSSIQLTGISSLRPIHNVFPFPVIKLPSLHDIIPPFSLMEKGIRFMANRLVGDTQILYGLERYANQFDIFQTADAHYYYSYQLARLRAHNKIRKLLITSWETIPFNNESVTRKKRHKYFVYHQADAFLCYSQKAKECLVKEGVSSHKITVIPLGVNLQLFKPVQVKQRRLTILFVGRLVEEKGVLDLYEAYQSILKSNLKLRLIGNGPLKKLIAPHIATFEQKKYEEMPAVYQQSSIFVLPSKKITTWEEQYGMVLIEAMASGLPIIAYDTGAIAEIIGNAGEIIVPDKMKLAQALTSLITNSQKRHQLSLLARQRAERYFNSQVTADKLVSYYKQLVKI